ncbi:CGNR zinc finger domain-containing protein [Sinomonas sp. ASV322]|uniref:CGNR zinc finger domain-containing protein n=1 Tax=Sinomonas sp. ASV322 TaxID=3041920 RepID=UPI0027DCE1DB|nr:CGNR zinc finger domain-containing protein [Sinomonas sp. ASV322]MDQ4503976.1 CGNR zinc finger domain-containing protein [Sinomonas sp. ASV322]
MLFAYDTEVALRTAVNLVNTLDSEGVEHLRAPGDLDRFLEQEEFTGSRTHDDDELASVRALRSQLRTLWDASEDDAVALVNGILRESRALPQLVKHDYWDWHLHATTPEAPLSVRMGTEAAMAFVDVIRSKELDRLRLCAADDCNAVLIDLSKNRSKRYCDTGNCANRAHVRAYRERKAAS